MVILLVKKTSQIEVVIHTQPLKTYHEITIVIEPKI